MSLSIEPTTSVHVRIFVTCHKCSAECNATNRISLMRIGWLPVTVRDDDAWLQTQLCPKCRPYFCLPLLLFRFQQWIAGWPLAIRKVLGCCTQLFAPGWGTCLRCRWPWRFVEGHSTYIGNGSGMFPLCEQCWEQLSCADRLPYYRQLFYAWDPEGRARVTSDWLSILKAVMEEK